MSSLLPAEPAAQASRPPSAVSELGVVRRRYTPRKTKSQLHTAKTPTMKIAVTLTLIILGALLIATPVIIRYLAAAHGFNAYGDAYTSCMFAGVGMVVAGIVFAVASLRSGGDSDKRN